jgi:hypothetical protein
MKRRLQSTATRVAVKPGTVHPVEYVPYKDLKKSDYNPRKMPKAKLERLATNIALFGFVENVVVRKETGEIIGGHQRIAALELLASGKFTPKNAEGKEIEFTPIVKVPVIYVEGLSDFDVKNLNLSLNSISGEWDSDKLGTLINQMVSEVETAMDNIAKDALAYLSPSGLSTDELNAIINKESEDGLAPERTTGVPKLNLEFTSKELRDAFKAFVGEEKQDGIPSGDLLAKRLGIEVVKKRKSKRT